MIRNLQVLAAKFMFDDWERLMHVLAGEAEVPPWVRSPRQFRRARRGFP